jgi:hypothetical protein
MRSEDAFLNGVLDFGIVGCGVDLARIGHRVIAKFEVVLINHIGISIFQQPQQ